ncbi:MAG TPA: hypothetical protein VFY83_09355, partial [Anaerolineales bacterium]|nr:hypothetical protein [Anaerolineales bacterium]
MTVDRDASTDKIFSRKLVKRWNVKHLSLVLATWCAILIIYRSLSLRFGIGDQINPLFAIPILLSGWLFGTWGGVFSTILAALAIIFMSAHANAELSHQIPGILIGLVSGLSSGWISSLWKQ